MRASKRHSPDVACFYSWNLVATNMPWKQRTTSSIFFCILCFSLSFSQNKRQESQPTIGWTVFMSVASHVLKSFKIWTSSSVQVIITVPDFTLPFLSPYNCCYHNPSLIQEAPIFNMPNLLLDVSWPGALTGMALEFRVGPQQPSFWRQANGDRRGSET